MRASYSCCFSLHLNSCYHTFATNAQQYDNKYSDLPTGNFFLRGKNSRSLESDVFAKIVLQNFNRSTISNFSKSNPLAKIKGSRVFLMRVAEKVIENILQKMCSTLSVRNVLSLVLRT